MLCCPVKVEVSATGWSLVQRSPTVCLYVWLRNPEKGGQRSALDYKRLWKKKKKKKKKARSGREIDHPDPSSAEVKNE
jgi:hypothetical protein